MSFQAQTWASKQRTGNPLTNFLLLTLANYADEDGECFPSQERLARDTEMSERAVREHLKKLEDLKLIERERRPGDGKRRRSDLIRLIAKKLPARDAGSSEGSTGTKRQELPAPSAGEPISEPTREKKKTASSSKSERLHTLPRGFAMTQSHVDKGAGFGLDVLETREEFDAFCNHFWATGKRYADWNCALTNWLRRAGRTKAERHSRQAPLGAGGARSGSYVDAAMRFAARAQAGRLPGQDRGGGGEDPLPF